jgi:hypothetical protein
MLAYPGLAFLCVAGGLAELAAAWALVPERGGPMVAARTLLAALRPASAGALPPLAAMAALLISLAAAQLAAPFNPLAPGSRNLLVAIVGLGAAAWLTWAWGWRRPNLEPALLVVVQGCWLLAVAAPAVVPQNLRGPLSALPAGGAAADSRVSAAGAAWSGGPGSGLAGAGRVRTGPAAALAALLRAFRLAFLRSFDR